VASLEVAVQRPRELAGHPFCPARRLWRVKFVTYAVDLVGLEILDELDNGGDGLLVAVGVLNVWQEQLDGCHAASFLR